MEEKEEGGEFILERASTKEMTEIFESEKKNHLDTSPNQNIREAQLKEVEIDFNYLVNEKLFEKGIHFVVKNKTGKIIASIGFYVEGEEGEIKHFSVDQEYRKKGLGRKLIQKIFEISKELNCKSIKLLTIDFMEIAVSFYQKIGFLLYHSYFVYAIDGEWLNDNCSEMERKGADSAKIMLFKIQI